MTPHIRVSREALLHNLEQFRQLAGPSKKTIAVVKANAYGVGMKEVVSVIESHTDAFAIDDISELLQLREMTTRDIYVLGYVPDEQVGDAVRAGGILPVYDQETVSAIAAIGEPAEVNIKLDALLGRQGVLLEGLEELVGLIKKYPQLHIRGLYTHFSNIEDTEDLTHAKAQIEHYHKALKALDLNCEKHISSTAGVLAFQDDDLSTHVRIGIGLYGLWPSESLKEKCSPRISLEPVATWVAPLSQVKNVPIEYPIGYGRTYITEKPMKIAVVPQGYSDGYDRKLSNAGEVLVQGQRCSVLGRVAMNMFVIDVTHLAHVKRGDEAVLLGKQGHDEITAEEIAAKTDTINYEIIVKLNPLLERVVV